MAVRKLAAEGFEALRAAPGRWKHRRISDGEVGVRCAGSATTMGLFLGSFFGFVAERLRTAPDALGRQRRSWSGGW